MTICLCDKVMRAVEVWLNFTRGGNSLSASRYSGYILVCSVLCAVSFYSSLLVDLVKFY